MSAGGSVVVDEALGSFEPEQREVLQRVVARVQQEIAGD